MYGCLLAIAERESGCTIYKALQPTTDQDLCLNMSKLHSVANRQGGWTEADMAANGCVPSCSKSSFELQDPFVTNMPYDAFTIAVKEQLVENNRYTDIGGLNLCLLVIYR